MTGLGLLRSTQAAGRRPRSFGLGLGLAVCAIVALVTALATSEESARFDQAPEFPSQDPQQWIGPAQSLKGLEGKVVILDVWTFG